ncbi:virulence factor Mce-like protein [Nocardia transvalensis]|uniref:Virulence factor Mce-like protein n=1 Tax=Nocardia transvalensis TaxID=37333 RepID=A0A7W9UHW6_9NOCA|nr:MlaD family protein [Nocardia transvalensis]MBB5913818.1 virulence factor Mce-like protein [Nocardia transvalensis]
MKLTKPRPHRPARAAKAAVIGALALAVGSCSLVPAGVQDAVGATHHVTADFRNIAGMYEGNPVTVLGLEVGKVDKIVPKGMYAEVFMTIDGDVKLPKNLTASLMTKSVVTDRHIELGPPYTGGPELPDNAHLTVEQTRTPVELDTVIKTIDQFADALKPPPGQKEGPMSGTLLYDMVNGQGEKIRDTLNALSGALKVGVDNKDAVSTIIIKLNELTTMLAENDQAVRDFSNQTTQMTSLLAEQAPGLQATLTQMNDFLSNTSGVFTQYQDQLSSSLTGLTAVTDQLRANAGGVTEVVDVAPLLLQNIDRVMDRDRKFVRLRAVLGTALSGEIISLFCERIQMRSDGCRTGRVEDLGPDLGLTAALMGMTK